MSQTEFANLTKNIQTSISRLEKGVNEVGILTIVNICKELGISADWLLLDKEDDSLREDEKEMLKIYNGLNDKNKQRLIGKAELMLEEQEENDSVTETAIS